jgi:probable phosphoglycerate mutase
VTTPNAPLKLIIEADGGSRGNPGPAGYGVVVRDGRTGQVLAERGQFLGEVTNNVAEYSGLVAGIETALEINPVALLDIRLDSRLVVQQMLGHWKIKHEDMRRLATHARSLLMGASATFTWVPRAANSGADRLVNEAIDARSAIRRDFEPEAPPAAEAPVAPPQAEPPAAQASSPETGADAGPHPGEAVLGGQGSGGADSAAAAGDTRPNLTPVPEREDQPAGQESAPATRAEDRWRRAGAQSHRTPSGRYRAYTRSRPTTVLLARHGSTDVTESESQTFSGAVVPGPGLSARGREEAQALGALIKRVALGGLWPDVGQPIALLTSPTARTRETAAAVGDAIGLEAVADYSFIEASFGDWDGLTAAQVEERWPRAVRRWFTDADFQAEGGGESQNEVYTRLKRGLTRVVESYPVSTIVVISHAIAIRAALGVALGAPAQAWMRFRIAPGSLTALHFWPTGETEILAQNWTLLDL